MYNTTKLIMDQKREEWMALCVTIENREVFYEPTGMYSRRVATKRSAFEHPAPLDELKRGSGAVG